MKDRSQQAIAASLRFEIPRGALQIEPLGSGHIHETWLVAGAGAQRFVLQQMNVSVFRNPRHVIDNIARVTQHIAAKVRDDCRCLSLVPASNGGFLYIDDEGATWRMFLMIAQGVAFDVAPDAGYARQAAAAFGRFQAMLSDLPAPPLHETIPDFHNTASRFSQFTRAIECDTQNRASSVQPEIHAILQREFLSRVFEDLRSRKELPSRTVHNDTKLNNVLFHERSGEALCVIDLDTVMPGLSLHDFGDLVRTAGTQALEDETNLDLVELDPPMFTALAGGYLAEARSFLSAREIEMLHLSPQVITFEVAMRFLTDYLGGDTYFRIHHPEHNVQRCRAQLKLVESMERKEQWMQQAVRDAASRLP